MLPRVGIGDQILEVMGWVPGFLQSLTALSGGEPRMAGLDVSVAACLTGQALNIGYGPVSGEDVTALDRRRLGHVGRTYLRAANYTGANPHLIARQAGIGFARALGGGLVAAIDGMRFVVPVPSLLARPNRKYFGPKRGMTWLNAINDQAFGIGHKSLPAPTVTACTLSTCSSAPVRRTCPRCSSPIPVLIPTWSSGSHSCWEWTTARRWPICPTRKGGGPRAEPTTGP